MKLGPFVQCIAGVLIAIAVTGCGESNPTNSFQPIVDNEPDVFTFRASNVYVVTSRLTYNWSNSGERASIYHATARTSGSATLILLDAQGTQVYQSLLRSGVTEVANAGVPGTWTVVVLLEEFTGTVNFQVSKL